MNGSGYNNKKFLAHPIMGNEEGSELAFAAEYHDLYNEYKPVRMLYTSAIREIQARLSTLNEEFSTTYNYNPIHHIESRIKRFESIVKKLQSFECDLCLDSIRNRLTDIAGIRIICNYIGDIKRVAELILRQDDITLIKKRDYIATPKPTGYRSLHLVVTVPVYLSNRTEIVPVEIQIRTIAMDFWASLEHDLRYKSESEVTDRQRIRLKQCAESIAVIDNEMQSLGEDLDVISKS